MRGFGGEMANEVIGVGRCELATPADDSVYDQSKGLAPE
jgi:hypothetical protein